MAAQNIVKKAISHLFHLLKLRRDLKKNTYRYLIIMLPRQPVSVQKRYLPVSTRSKKGLASGRKLDLTRGAQNAEKQVLYRANFEHSIHGGIHDKDWILDYARLGLRPHLTMLVIMTLEGSI